MIVVRVIVTCMRMVRVIMMRVPSCRRCSGRRRGADGLRRCACRAQRRQHARPFDPEQPHADRDDQRVADDLDPADRGLHGRRGRAQQHRGDADDHHRDQRLQHRRRERQHDAAPPGLVIGDDVGRDHRLAVAGAGGVEDAVEERQAEQSSRPRCRRSWRRGSRRTDCDRIRPAWRRIQPTMPSGCGGARCRRARRRTAALRQRDVDRDDDQRDRGNRDGGDRRARARLMQIPSAARARSGTFDDDLVGELRAEMLRRVELLVGAALEQLGRQCGVHLLRAARP